MTPQYSPKRSAVRALGVLVSTIALACGLAACAAERDPFGDAETRNKGLIDAAGLTEREAFSIPLREHFELIAQRDTRMAELLAEAQLQVSEEPWTWGEYGVIPVLGPNAWSVRGMKLENSYFLSMWVWIEPEGARGDEADLEPLLTYFESKGWKVHLRSEGTHRHQIVADTGEGFLVSWRVKPNGIYNLGVFSKSYWGDSRMVQRAIGYRIPPDGLDIDVSLPGVHAPFPSWDDPEIYGPTLVG